MKRTEYPGFMTNEDLQRHLEELPPTEVVLIGYEPDNWRTAFGVAGAWIDDPNLGKEAIVILGYPA